MIQSCSQAQESDLKSSEAALPLCAWATAIPTEPSTIVPDCRPPPPQGFCNGPTAQPPQTR
eukprot:11159980-Lingulodinium_polyedra.AAC.1